MPEADLDAPAPGEIDTIFAPASGLGQAAIAVIRISGPEAHRVLEAITAAPLPPWRELTLRHITAADGEMIDEAMVAAFPKGASYTGEALAEVQCHGGTAVLAGVLGRIAEQPGCRMAEPGEFTRRALTSGRMNLPAVEGLADLVAAETAEQRRRALRVYSGAVSRQTEAWRGQLLRARALVEVTIDWADDDVPEDVGPELRPILARLQQEMANELARAAAAERMRSGYEVAIVGPPNAGKSSLLNAIVGREAAIVSETPGTTRDVLEVRVDLGGLPVTFLDTAGLREAHDPVEVVGVARGRSRAEAADLRVYLFAPDAPPAAGGEMEIRREDDLRVWAKSDLGAGPGDLAIAAPMDLGVGELLAAVRERLARRAAEAGLFGTERQRVAVEASAHHLSRAVAALPEGGPELVAEELRLATAALDRLVGRIDVDDVLGEIFEGFCLGK